MANTALLRLKLRVCALRVIAGTSHPTLKRTTRAAFTFPMLETNTPQWDSPYRTFGSSPEEGLSAPHSIPYPRCRANEPAKFAGSRAYVLLQAFRRSPVSFRSEALPATRAGCGSYNSDSTEAGSRDRKQSWRSHPAKLGCRYRRLPRATVPSRILG